VLFSYSLVVILQNPSGETLEEVPPTKVLGYRSIMSSKHKKILCLRPII